MTSLRDKTAIVGIGETEYVRRSPRGAKELILEAVQKALDDAKIKPEEVDGIVTEGMDTPELIRDMDLSYTLGLNPRFSATGPPLGGGNVACPLIAAMAITSGQADVVLTYFSNNFGTRPGIVYGEGLEEVKISSEMPYGCVGTPIWYGLITQRYMHEYGLTTRQLASVAVNQRRNAILNGKGIMSKKPLSYEDYENSPMVSDPLRRPDFCLMNDGACAWVMTSAERAKSCPNKPVYVMGGGLGFMPIGFADIGTVRPGHYLHNPDDAIAIENALKMAGITRTRMEELAK